VKVHILSVARQEFRDAARWYDERQPGVGRRFARAVIDVLKRIRENPERFALYEGKNVEGDYRRAIVRKFPYLIVYRIEGDVIVVSCQHASREPGYWEGR
jgi:hypothetical protein